jgi:hypothetical protein
VLEIIEYVFVSTSTNFHACKFVFIFVPPDPLNVMNGTKDKNETAVERTQKNKYANKQVV